MAFVATSAKKAGEGGQTQPVVSLSNLFQPKNAASTPRILGTSTSTPSIWSIREILNHPQIPLNAVYYLFTAEQKCNWPIIDAAYVHMLAKNPLFNSYALLCNQLD